MSAADRPKPGAPPSWAGLGRGGLDGARSMATALAGLASARSGCRQDIA